MKTALALIFSALMTLYGFNVGMSMGLSAKPVLNMDNCATVIRYEDNSLVCTPLKAVQTAASPIELELNGPLQGAENTVQRTVDGATLQPARNEQR